MLAYHEYQEISKIIEKSNEYLVEHQVEDFSIFGVVWNDEDNEWVVIYYSDYGNNEFINICVKFVPNSTFSNPYEIASHSFEKIEVTF